MERQEENFLFWMPAEISKAVKVNPKTGKKEMRMSGIASVDVFDLDDQLLKTNGFDISYLNSRGFINYHHQAKHTPKAIIGEPIPSKTRISSKGLEIEALIYDTELGRECYETQEMLEKNSKTGRRLGWSIEGKATEKEGSVIKRARITGVALTYAPKNAPTFAQIVKSFSDEQIATDVFEKSKQAYFELGETIYEEKSTEAGTGRGFESNPLKKESLERDIKPNNFKPAVIPRILIKVFKKYPTLDLDKALEIHDEIYYKCSKKN